MDSKKTQTIDELKQQFVEGKLETGMYSSKDEDGNDIIVMIQEGVGFNIKTNQENGWIRVDSFDYDKEKNWWYKSESYDGKWK